MSPQTIIITVFILLMAMLFVIGFLASRITRSEVDFFLGGRKLCCLPPFC